MRVRHSYITHSRDGYYLDIEDVRLVAVIEERITEFFCHISKGYLCPLCLCSRWDWIWKIAWGKRDEYFGPACCAEELPREHSLGRWLFHLGQRCPEQDARQVYRCQVPFEDVCKYFPDSRVEDDDDGVHYRKGVMIKEREE